MILTLRHVADHKMDTSNFDEETERFSIIWSATASIGKNSSRLWMKRASARWPFIAEPSLLASVFTTISVFDRSRRAL